jgi:hypothetical protein
MLRQRACGSRCRPKKGNDTVKKVKGDSPKGAKAGADGTTGGDK